MHISQPGGPMPAKGQTEATEDGAPSGLAVGAGFGEVCVYATRRRMHHLRRDKRLLCNRREPAYLELVDVLETPDEANALLAPHNLRYLCAECERRMRAILSSPNIASQTAAPKTENLNP